MADPLKNIDEFAPPAPRPGGIAARARAAATGNAAYLEGLNPEQLEAVEGQRRVTDQGAGSGLRVRGVGRGLGIHLWGS